LRHRLTRAWLALKEAVLSPEFWLLLAWVTLTLGALAWLGWLAARHFDTFLRLKPLICEAGIGNRQFLVIALLAPIGLAFALAACGELWLLRAASRAGHPGPWRHFILFAALALSCAVVILNALGC
jgi:hypothetical protein